MHDAYRSICYMCVCVWQTVFLYSIPAQTLTPVPCGFDKTFHFNMGFVGNRSCNGELSDCEQSTILKRTWDMCDEPETEGEYSTVAINAQCGQTADYFGKMCRAKAKCEKSIWRKNVNQNISNNSPSNIL